MWKPNVRPYDEYFAKKQAITTTAVVGNVAANNPMRLDAAQGATAIRVAVPLDASLVVANAATVTLTVRAAKLEAGTPIVIGTALYTNDTGAAVTFGPDATLLEFILPQATFVYPYVQVQIEGSAAPTGSVDIFPHQVSQPRR